jgi:hypothetical protein
MKKSFKAPKKCKINFGPQDPINKKRHLANTIRTAGGTGGSTGYYSHRTWDCRRYYSFRFPILSVFKKKNARKKMSRNGLHKTSNRFRTLFNLPYLTL